MAMDNTQKGSNNTEDQSPTKDHAMGKKKPKTQEFEREKLAKEMRSFAIVRFAEFMSRPSLSNVFQWYLFEEETHDGF